MISQLGLAESAEVAQQLADMMFPGLAPDVPFKPKPLSDEEPCDQPNGQWETPWTGSEERLSVASENNCRVSFGNAEPNELHMSVQCQTLDQSQRQPPLRRRSTFSLPSVGSFMDSRTTIGATLSVTSEGLSQEDEETARNYLAMHSARLTKMGITDIRGVIFDINGPLTEINKGPVK